MLDNTSGQASEGSGSDNLPTPKSAELIAVSFPQPSTAAQVEPAGHVVEFDTAVKRGAASFNQLAAAIFYSQGPFMPDPAKRVVYGGYIEPLTEAFEAAHGHIT